MRIIDADKITYYRQDAIETFSGMTGEEMDGYLVTTRRMINKIPVIDAVAVTRCRDCKHFNTEHYHNAADDWDETWCDLLTDDDTGAALSVKPDCYCFRAERGPKE